MANFPLFQLLLSLLLQALANATEYTYVLTFGSGDIVCHAGISFLTAAANPPNLPPTEGSIDWLFCASTGTLHERRTYTFPANQLPVIYVAPRERDANDAAGERAIEIGIDMPARSGNGFNIPAIEPRVEVVVNQAGIPLWFCNYRQGALQVAQRNGHAAAAEPAPNPDPGPSTRGGAANTEVCRRSGTQFLTAIGVWLLFQSTCKAKPKPPLALVNGRFPAGGGRSASASSADSAQDSSMLAADQNAMTWPDDQKVDMSKDPSMLQDNTMGAGTKHDFDPATELNPNSQTPEKLDTAQDVQDTNNPNTIPEDTTFRPQDLDTLTDQNDKIEKSIPEDTINPNNQMLDPTIQNQNKEAVPESENQLSSIPTTDQTIQNSNDPAVKEEPEKEAALPGLMSLLGGGMAGDQKDQTTQDGGGGPPIRMRWRRMFSSGRRL